MTDLYKGLRPLFLVKPGTVNRRDITRAEKQSGICIVECADPESARFCEPPIGVNLDDQGRAAISLMRIILSAQSNDFTRGQLTRWFVDALLSGKTPTPVTPVKRP